MNSENIQSWYYNSLTSSNVSWFTGGKIRPIFAIGHMNGTVLSQEIKKHGDVLEMSIVENYFKISFKIIGGLLWISRYPCN